MSGKFKLWDMSWKEAEEAFNRSDMVILPVGTIHGHGPTPISIDSSSVERLAEEVGKKTCTITLPLVAYGENEKQKYYPGSIAISVNTLEHFYVDIFKSLYRNGVKKIIILNGHGGNRETIINAARKVRELGILIVILEWWSLGRQLMPELFPEAGSYIAELAVSLVIDGKEVADLRGTGYKGEWGDKYTMKNIFGENINPLGFNNFEYKKGRIIIPIQAWDLDLEGPPVLGREVVDELYERGLKILQGLVKYLCDFVEEFKKIDIQDALKSKD